MLMGNVRKITEMDMVKGHSRKNALYFGTRKSIDMDFSHLGRMDLTSVEFDKPDVPSAKSHRAPLNSTFGCMINFGLTNYS